MAMPIAGQEATPGEPGTRPAAGGDQGLPGRRSRARPELGARAARQGGEFPRGRAAVRPENRT